jgi:hypothetical protein
MKTGLQINKLPPNFFDPFKAKALIASDFIGY